MEIGSRVQPNSKSGIKTNYKLGVKTLGSLEYLKYGVIGLCAIIMYFSYSLLAGEVGKPKPRPQVLRAIHIFMLLAVAPMIVGLISQIPLFSSRSQSSATVRTSALEDNYFNDKWDLMGHDVDFGSFKARYDYKGVLAGHVQDNELVLEGDIVTIDQKTGVERGTAHFLARGPINNNQVTAYYTYKNSAVNGFGTAFIEFDSSGHGQMYLVFRITRTIPGEGDIGSGEFTIARRSSKSDVNLDR